MIAEDEEPKSLVEEVKYSLRTLLKEVESERAFSELAREAVDQEEISKLFQRNRSKKRSESGK